MKDDSKITVKATGEKQNNEDSCDIVYDQTINISTEDIPDSSSVKRVPYSVVKKSVPDSTTIDFSSSPLKVQVFTEGNDQSNKRSVTVKGAVQENDFDQASGAVSSSGFSVGSIASGSSTCSEENGESAPLEKEPCTTETNNPVNSDDSTKDSSHSRNEEAQSPKVSLEEESSKGSLEVHSHKLSQEDESPKICQEEMSPEENMNEQSPEERMEEKSPEERMEEQSPKESLEERSPSVDEDDKKSEDEEESSSSEDSSDDSSDDDDSDNDKEDEQSEESDDAEDEERGSPVTKETSETHGEHIVELQLFADSDDSFLEDEDDEISVTKIVNTEQKYQMEDKKEGCFVSKNYTYMAEIFIDISTTQDCSNQCYIKALVDGFNSYHCLGKEVFYQKVEEFLKRVNMAYDNAKKKDELTKKSHRILGSLGNQLLRSCFNWGWCDVGYKMITLLKFHRIHYYKYNPQEASSPHIDVVTTEMCQKLDLVSEALQIIEGNGWHCLRNVNQDPDVLMCTIEILKVLMSHLLNKNRPAEVTRILLQLLQRKSDENMESCFSNINFTVFFEHVVKRSLAISDLFSARGAYNIYENCIGEQGLPVGLRRGLLSAWGTWYQTEGIQSLFDDLLEHNIYPTQVIEDSPRIIQIWTSLTLAEVKLILQDYLNSLYAFLCELLKEKRTKYLSEQDLSLGIKIINKDSDPTVAPLGCLTPQNVLAMKSALITLLEEEFKPALIVANRYAAQYNPQQDFLCRIFSPSLLEYLQEIDKKKLKRGLLFSKEISNQVSSHTRRNNPTHRIDRIRITEVNLNIIKKDSAGTTDIHRYRQVSALDKFRFSQVALYI
ncbi:hypothetical protein FSP39_003094 [Pinctada imbricata]|uniref:Uncharacterized protein n=1 Tax=Pinctada imbricata TaxID=66713 RepID=A0AA89BXX6_PINIB|nr:hypothetical protein FSP39_003094 [Pinctada imbricata]